MASNARNLANLLGTGETTISASKLGDDIHRKLYTANRTTKRIIKKGILNKND